MDTKERVPDYRMSCTLKQFEDAINGLSDEVKRNAKVEVDFYYTDKVLEKEFKDYIYEHSNIKRF